MKVTGIWAECQGIIGINGGLAVHDKRDMQIFKSFTNGGVLVMGRKTVESLPKKLEGRTVLCLSSNPKFSSEKCDHIFSSKQELVNWAKEHNVIELIICGGEHVYNTFMPHMDTLIVTDFNPNLLPKKTLSSNNDLTMAPLKMLKKGSPDDAILIEQNENFTTTCWRWHNVSVL